MTMWDKFLKIFESPKKSKDDKNLSSFGSAMPRKAGDVGNKNKSISDGSSINKGRKY